MLHNSGRNRIALLAVALALAAAGPPALPGPQAISATDKASGAKAHPDLLAEYGGPWQGPQAALVTRAALYAASYGRGVRAEVWARMGSGRRARGRRVADAECAGRRAGRLANHTALFPRRLGGGLPPSSPRPARAPPPHTEAAHSP